MSMSRTLSVLCCTILTLSLASCESDAKRKLRLEKERKGYHCLHDSVIGGQHEGFIKLVEAKMRKPEFFRHEGTTVKPVDKNGNHYIGMLFYGEVAGELSSAEGYYSHETCKAVLTEFYGWDYHLEQARKRFEEMSPDERLGKPRTR